MKKQIIAMGGGGFSMEPENLLLDQYVLAQVAKPKPKVCFVATASGDAEGYVRNFYTAFGRLPAELSHLPFFARTPRDLEAFVREKDVVYVGGGNTKSMLAVWRDWGFDTALRRAYDAGVVLCGVSAGALCWFEEGVTDSVSGSLGPIPCLGFLKGSHCPHYDGEVERRPAYRSLLERGALSSGVAADDGAAIHFINGKIEAAVSSRPSARAYRVSRDGEESLPTRYLG